MRQCQRVAANSSSKSPIVANKFFIWLAAAFFVVCPTPTTAAEIPAPKLAKLILATLASDQNLAASGTPLRIAVTGSSKLVDMYIEAFDAFAGQLVQGRTIEVSTVLGAVATIDWARVAPHVVLLTDRIQPAAGTSIEKLHAGGVRTVTLHATDVAKGILFGFSVLETGRAELLINQAVAQNVGAAFTNQIVKFARFVGAAPDYIVVVNQNRPLHAMSMSMLQDIYLGRLTTWPDGSKIVALLPPESDPTRRVFIEKALGLSPGAFEQTWSELLQADSTRQAPVSPPTLDVESETIYRISGAIGIFPASFAQTARKVHNVIGVTP